MEVLRSGGVRECKFISVQVYDKRGTISELTSTLHTCMCTVTYSQQLVFHLGHVASDELMREIVGGDVNVEKQ